MSLSLPFPLFSVLSTGDELVDCATEPPLSYGQIRDSNRPMLLSLLDEAGARTVDLGMVTDHASQLESKVLSALDSVDFLVLSGGVSMGVLDLLKPLLERVGTIHFGRLNMKPGKPTTFATVMHGPTAETKVAKLVFGLPGNPVSSLVCAQLLLLPAVRMWRRGTSEGISGESAGYPLLPVRTLSDLKPDAQRPEYHRVRVWFDSASNGGEFVASSTGNQISSRLLSVCNSNGLMLVPKGDAVVKKGTVLKTIMVGDFNLPGFDGDSASSSSSSSSGHAAPAPSLPPKASEPHSHSHSHGAHKHAPAPVASSSASSSGAPPVPPSFSLRVAVLTVSDRCSAGQAVDLSGPAIQNLLGAAVLKGTTIRVSHSACVPDEMDVIQRQLLAWTSLSASDEHPHLIVTTGGTGFAPRDITPEAVSRFIERSASGLVHAMMEASLKATPMGALSRPVAGTRDRSLILTLPGSPKAIPEILGPILAILPHACKLLQSKDDPHVTPSPQPTAKAAQ